MSAIVTATDVAASGHARSASRTWNKWLLSATSWKKERKEKYVGSETPPASIKEKETLLVQSAVCLPPPGQRRKRSMSGKPHNRLPRNKCRGKKPATPTHTSKAERTGSPTHRLRSSP